MGQSNGEYCLSYSLIYNIYILYCHLEVLLEALLQYIYVSIYISFPRRKNLTDVIFYNTCDLISIDIHRDMI